MDSSRMGDTQRPVVPITPSLTIPETSVCSALTSNEIDSSSVWTRRARSTTRAPSSVSTPVRLSIKDTDSSCSSLAIWVEMFD